MLAPSLNSLFFTGALLLIIFIIVLHNYRKIIALEYYKKLTLLSLIVIAMGIHGLIHLGVEVAYNFNPFNI